MNIRDIADAIAAEIGITRAAAEAALRAMLGSVVRGLRKGDRVLLPGVGALTAVRRNARRACHPGTGAAIVIPARTTVKFSPAAGMLAQLNTPDQAAQ